MVKLLSRVEAHLGVVVFKLYVLGHNVKVCPIVLTPFGQVVVKLLSRVDAHLGAVFLLYILGHNVKDVLLF